MKNTADPLHNPRFGEKKKKYSVRIYALVYCYFDKWLLAKSHVTDFIILTITHNKHQFGSTIYNL